MSQQINLFNPLFLKKKRYFSFATMAQSLGVLLVGLAAFYGYARYQETILEDEGKAATIAFDAEKARLAKFTAEFAPANAQQDIDKAIGAAKAEITNKQAVIAQLQSGVLGNTKGYSDFLGAFARRAQPGVWLTSIQIGPGDESLSITGRALQGEQVSTLLTQYRAEPALKGRPFNGVTIARASGYVEFRLTSGQFERPAPEGDQAAAASAATPAGAPAIPIAPSGPPTLPGASPASPAAGKG